MCGGFFFLFFLHRTSIRNGQQGISYNSPITAINFRIIQPHPMNPKKVKTEADLRLYLTRKWWTHIVIDEELVIHDPIFIDRNVTILCGKYGRVLANYYEGDSSHHSLFTAKASGVEFESMKIECADYRVSQFQSAIMYDCEGGVGMVRKSSIFNFSWGGIWQFNCDSLTVDGNTKITGAGTTSYNYGIWQGGKTDIPEMKLTVINCDIKDVRHAIGASYHPNSYYAIGNIISTMKHSFDRHNWNGGGGIRKGGLHTVISGNTFLDSDRLAFSIEPPYEGGSFVFTGNSLNHSKERHIGEIAGEQVWESSGSNYLIGANTFTD